MNLNVGVVWLPIVVWFVFEEQWYTSTACGLEQVMDGKVLDLCYVGHLEYKPEVYLSNSKLSARGFSECVCDLIVRTTGSEGTRAEMLATFVDHYDPIPPDVTVMFNNGDTMLNIDQRQARFWLVIGHNPPLVYSQTSNSNKGICIKISADRDGQLFSIFCQKNTRDSSTRVIDPTVITASTPTVTSTSQDSSYTTNDNTVVIDSTTSSTTAVQSSSTTTVTSELPDEESDMVPVLVGAVCVGIVAVGIVVVVLLFRKRKRAVTKDNDDPDDDEIENPMYNIDMNATTRNASGVHQLHSIKQQSSSELQQTNDVGVGSRNTDQQGNVDNQETTHVNSYDYIDDIKNARGKDENGQVSCISNGGPTVPQSPYDYVRHTDTCNNSPGYVVDDSNRKQGDTKHNSYAVIKYSDKYSYAHAIDSTSAIRSGNGATGFTKKEKTNWKEAEQSHSPRLETLQQEHVYNHTNEVPKALPVHEYGRLGKLAKLNTKPLNMYDTAKYINN